MSGKDDGGGPIIIGNSLRAKKKPKAKVKKAKKKK